MNDPQSRGRRLSATHGIGSPLFGHVSVNYRDQKFALDLASRKTEVGTIAIPMQVVGYWVDGSKSIRIKITDDQLLRTLVHIEAMETKGDYFLGEAYMQLREKDPSRRMVVKCTVD